MWEWRRGRREDPRGGRGGAEDEKGPETEGLEGGPGDEIVGLPTPTGRVEIPPLAGRGHKET